MTTRGRPFAPGNPGGGRKRIPEDVLEACRASSTKAVKILTGILTNEAARDADRIRAAEIILNRGYGLPKQAVENSGANSDPFNIMSMTREEAKARLAELRAMDAGNG